MELKPLSIFTNQPKLKEKALHHTEVNLSNCALLVCSSLDEVTKPLG